MVPSKRSQSLSNGIELILLVPKEIQPLGIGMLTVVVIGMLTDSEGILCSERQVLVAHSDPRLGGGGLTKSGESASGKAAAGMRGSAN
jgi:hypothetical protein